MEWSKINYATIFGSDGKPTAAVGIAEDVTELVNTQNAYEQSATFAEGYNDPRIVSAVLLNVSTGMIEKWVKNTAFSENEDHAVHYYTPLNRIAKKVDPEYRERFLAAFSLERYKRLYAENKDKAELEYSRQTDQGFIGYFKTTVKLMKNPVTDELMGLLSTIDITGERTMQAITQNVMCIEYERIALIDARLDNMILYRYKSKNNLSHTCINSYTGGLRELLSQKVVSEELDKAVEAMSLAHIMKELENKKLYSCAFSVMESNGQRAQKKWQFSYLDRHSRIIMASKGDITTLFNEQVRQQEALRNALIQAEHASLAKSNFLSRMSHEIRTPMNAIIGMSSLAKESIKDPAKVADCIGKVDLSARFLLSLINDILDMSRIESGKMTVRKEEIPFEEFIEGINAICHEQAKEKGIAYSCVMTGVTQECYMGDTMKLQQIMINIIGNAVKFTERGGEIRFLVNQDRLEKGRAYMRFTVQDTGVGISEDFLPKMFEPFEQEYMGSMRTIKGTGLGLAICKNLVALMGGQITAKSKLGRGTEFTVVIPLALRSQDMQESGGCGEKRPAEKGTEEKGKRMEEKREAGKGSAARFKGQRVLLVEDNLINIEIARHLLEKKGLQVEIAENGLAAVEAYTGNGAGGFDAILMDISMPLMDGLAAARSIRSSRQADAETIPIIAMSANAFDEDAEKSKAAGMNAHLTKPIDPQLLFQTLQEFFEPFDK